MKKIFILLLPLYLTSCVETIAITSFGSAYLITRTKPVEDSLIDAKISAQLAKEIKLHKNKELSNNLYFNVYQGRVLLTGTLNKQNNLTQISDNIWQIDGVKELINETSIKGQTKRKIITDYYLASKVKSKFMLKKDIKAFNINVEVYNQNVYLIGNVTTENEVKKAAKAAATVKGVKKVTSFLRKI